MENTNVMEGTQVPFDASIPSSGMEIAPVHNNGGEIREISNKEAILGMAIIGLGGYAIGKLGEVLWFKVIGPGSKKLSKKFDESMKKRGKQKPAKEDVIDGKEVNDDATYEYDTEQPQPAKGSSKRK